MLYATVCDRLRLAAKSQKTDSKSADRKFVGVRPWVRPPPPGTNKINNLSRYSRSEIESQKSSCGCSSPHLGAATDNVAAEQHLTCPFAWRLIPVSELRKYARID